jgi:hypothetical protein
MITEPPSLPNVMEALLPTVDIFFEKLQLVFAAGFKAPLPLLINVALPLNTSAVELARVIAPLPLFIIVAVSLKVLPPLDVLDVPPVFSKYAVPLKVVLLKNNCGLLKLMFPLNTQLFCIRSIALPVKLRDCAVVPFCVKFLS